MGKESGGKRVVFYKPPDLECCFLAYSTLNDDIIDWITRYRRTAQKRPEFLLALNKGDCEGAAKLLLAEHYYSQDESNYAKSMITYKKKLDILSRLRM